MKSPQDMRIIQIDITNACMYQCSNCTRFCGHHKKNFFMDFATFKKAADSMVGYHGTIGIMGGEPTLHPEFERIISYLRDCFPDEYKKNHRSLIAPQKDFIQSILIENKKNSEVYQYSTGKRETIVGAGLWSAMVPSYKKYYEIIQDTFNMQAVNDHGNTMYHSPILINRKDLGIPDDEWIKIRDNCWAQETWSATITPKGAFFCEIAGALDMLFDGPGGWPIEPGWWKRKPEEFGEQLKWCEMCGIAIETFTRNANDRIDDVSESMYKQLLEIDSPKLKHKDQINIVKVCNGQITEDSKRGALEVRKDLFYDSFVSRFNKNKSCLYPETIDVICFAADKSKVEISEWIKEFGSLFNKAIFIIKSDLYDDITSECDSENIVFIKNDPKIWGHSFAKALKFCSDYDPIIYLSSLFELNKENIASLKETVINPGTMHFSALNENTTDMLIGNALTGIAAMFSKNAVSLKKAGFDYYTNAESFMKIIEIWDKSKIIAFDTDMIEDNSDMRIQPNKKYVIYGAGNTGKSALKAVKEMRSEVLFIVDSDCKKWGTVLDDIDILSPDELPKREASYEKIIIASTFYREIKEKLDNMGFSEEKYIVHE